MKSQICLAVWALAFVFVATPTEAAQVWSAAADFTGTNVNPNGPWSYNYGGQITISPTGSPTQQWTPDTPGINYTPATFQPGPVEIGFANSGYFNQPSPDGAPWIYANNVNPLDNTVSSNNLVVGNFPYGYMGTHPNGSATPGAGSPTVLGDGSTVYSNVASAVVWTAPSAMTVKLDYNVQAWAPNTAPGLQFAVYDNTTPLFGGIHTLGTSDHTGGNTIFEPEQTLNVVAGEKLYFLVGPRANADNGAAQTEYQAVITQVTPEPATLGMLSVGLIGMVLSAVYRRRQSVNTTYGNR